MLSVDDIHKIEKHRKDIRKEIYKKIYEQFCRKIKQCVELNESQAFLRTPSYLVGYPTFDRERATVYIKRQLELGKFDVTFLSNIDLYVSWKKKKYQSSQQPKVEKTTSQQFEHEDDGFPTLMNLRKAAAKYRK
tara:strand:- start:120 stop:521 length:402 start_codon:yes stop_codon:yes gene_type:complete